MEVSHLIKWSQTEFAQLPWRQKRSLYRTLVSEIMLQQTTVGTVKNHYERFLKTFPDLGSLAQASEEELLVAWKGLGYYRRARNLKKIAEAIFREHGGEFPKDADSLQLIPGIGPYTSQALVAIGMDRRGLAVDANLERVIARLYGIKEEKGPKLQKKIGELFVQNEIFSKTPKSFRALNEALMDLGRTFCQARKASCELCPMSKSCHAFKNDKPLNYPHAGKTKTKAQEHELHLLRAFVMKGKKLLVYKKENSQWLSGQYEVPTFILRTTDEKLAQYQRLKTKLKFENATTYQTGITKYKITNYVFELKADEFKKFEFKSQVEWRSIDDSKANLSTATLKGLKHLSK